MRLALNYKNGTQEVLSEDNTKKVIASINYLKAIKFLMSSKKIEPTTIKILDREISTAELKSVEVML